MRLMPHLCTVPSALRKINPPNYTRRIRALDVGAVRIPFFKGGGGSSPECGLLTHNFPSTLFHRSRRSRVLAESPLLFYFRS